jgi:nitrogenase molybdenum-iron protein beta chain
MTLLRHTPTDITERKALRINPAKTCQPIGAMYAALGINKCLPHSHGSQGCCAYHRSTLTRHYKEPVSAATSSFTEGASVFGGQANLLQAINNIFTVYEPDVIAVHTTCLSETIGDDIYQIADKAEHDGKVPKGKHVIGAPTPSFVGSHVTGYANMLKGALKCLAKSSGVKSNKLNVISGWVEPADYAEIKRICKVMGIPITLLPDTDGVLNAPMTGRYDMYPSGGTTAEEIVAMADAYGTLGLGDWGTSEATRFLDTQHKVPCKVLDLPIGLAATDRFVDALRTVAGVNVPDEITVERGQLVDIISDMAQYFFRKKVAVVGDPDQVIALTEFLVTLDMCPTHIVTGTPGKRFEKRIREITADSPFPVNVAVEGDMFLLHQWIKNDPVDLIVGNTYCKYIARDEDIPMLRHGFPIIDRQGHQFFPTVGYKGAMRLVEQILNLLLDRRDRDDPEEKFELVY